MASCGESGGPYDPHDFLAPSLNHEPDKREEQPDVPPPAGRHGSRSTTIRTGRSGTLYTGSVSVHSGPTEDNETKKIRVRKRGVRETEGN